ncbi:MAG: hypothetical protein AUJ20_14015 [Comamonadaceae bacterium CG1_02_60_18]|nr:MAG: hypothetical protein AUJ20_14015 [Comamonadaceae bacterium CG1_02_60_18]
MKLYRQIFFGYLLVSLLVLLVGVGGYSGLMAISEHFDHAINRTQPVLTALNRIRFQAANLTISAVTLPQPDPSVANARAELTAAIAAYKALVEKYFPDELKTASEIDEAAKSVSNAADKLKNYDRSSNENGFHKQAEQLGDTLNALLVTIDGAAAAEEREFQEYQDNVDVELKQHLMELLASCGVAIVFSIGGGALLTRRITHPIEELRQAVSRMGSGQLNTRVEISSKNEIGELAQAFNRMASDLSNTMVGRDYVESIIESLPEGVMVVTEDGDIVRTNLAMRQIWQGSRVQPIACGTLREMFSNTLVMDLLKCDLTNQMSIESGLQSPGDQATTVLLSSSGILHSSENGERVLLIEDITARKAHQRELEYVAHFDSLTNLPNRLLLADRLQQSLTQVTRRHLNMAVVFIDIDGFKNINDQHGHDMGDQLLVAVASAMKQTLREGDTLARLGGDEFVAVLNDLDNVAASTPMLDRLLSAAAHPYQIGKRTVQVSASLGVTFYPQQQVIDADQLLRQADQAMYQAKVTGKNRFCIFDPEQDRSLRVHHESLERIRVALDHGEFVLYYQPKVNMRSGQVVGVEALIRWQHPQQGLLAPGLFLPTIENDALAVAVGEWVIDSALSQIEDWRTCGLDLPVSVNVGALQLQQRDFVDQLRAHLQAHPCVNPSHLELEILETSALQDMDQVRLVIDACTKLGVRFALDDFGTGYSSLSYLKRLKVTLLKIDKSFVRDMLEDDDDLAILRAVIGLAQAFGRQVIAEGVETIAHGSLLLQLGCDLGQGFGIARPMPADKLPDWVTRWQSAPAWTA